MQELPTGEVFDSFRLRLYCLTTIGVARKIIRNPSKYVLDLLGELGDKTVILYATPLSALRGAISRNEGNLPPGRKVLLSITVSGVAVAELNDHAASLCQDLRWVLPRRCYIHQRRIFAKSWQNIIFDSARFSIRAVDTVALKRCLKQWRLRR